MSEVSEHRPFDGGPLHAAGPAGLRLTGVSHRFGPTTVIGDVSLTVDKGAIVCLLGPSGCGKTTLLRLAAGLERLQRGRIEIGGHVVADAATGLIQPPEARRVGLMFQDYALFPHLTVNENIRFGIGRAARNEAWLGEAMSRMGLRALSGAYPHTLSGGQQQRCALLRALAPHPDLLLLDEPFSGLDVALRAQVREETAAFLREAGISTLVVTHDPEEAMTLADQLLVMLDGAIVQQGAPSAIYFHPVNPFVAGLFGPLNRWTGRVSGGCVQTPIGAIAAAGLPEGTEAVVLVRPEGILIDHDGQGATVVESRLLGCCSAISLMPERAPWLVRSVVAGAFLPAPGTEVGVAIDARRTFAFAV